MNLNQYFASEALLAAFWHLYNSVKTNTGCWTYLCLFNCDIGLRIFCKFCHFLTLCEVKKTKFVNTLYDNCLKQVVKETLRIMQTHHCSENRPLDWKTNSYRFKAMTELREPTHFALKLNRFHLQYDFPSEQIPWCARLNWTS